MLKSDTAFSSLLKEGYRHYQGQYEVTVNNIEACKSISEITKTSYGPQGMQKLIVNHIDKLFVSNDASTILKEINVNHPAANLVNMSAQV
jgi:T-complex protein 1 subunit theta